MKTHIIDLNFLDAKETIACFLLESEEGPILIETGPESTYSQLRYGVEALGYDIKEIKHVFLTHIHFDHAGAAWKLAQHGAKIYVHPKGLPHLASPEKLWNSAALIYGDEMQRLWGKMDPIPLSNLQEVTHLKEIQIGELTLKAIHTPGHAVHHIAWEVQDNIFTGDIAGVSIKNGPVVPPCPPPDIHIENWKTSIQLLMESEAKNLFLTHYGKISNKTVHLLELEKSLNDWSLWIKKCFEDQIDNEKIIPEFMAYTQENLRLKGCDEDMIQLYEYANPSWMSVAGLMRYWKQKSLGKI